ncbi:MAG: hypothetical protein IJ614_08705 [Prevotella sp.]|nr:hypothetical protein [Prevotella sp.]
MKIQELHIQAMDLAEQADFLKMQGQNAEAKPLYEQSLQAEKEAAYLANSQQIGEPTESVLFRSAASLAYGLKDFREAERLICMGLAGNPPQDIARELRELYDQVNLERNLEQLNVNHPENKHEAVTITIPVKEKSLLQVLVRKFGWACVF